MAAHLRPSKASATSATSASSYPSPASLGYAADAPGCVPWEPTVCPESGPGGEATLKADASSSSVSSFAASGYRSGQRVKQLRLELYLFAPLLASFVAFTQIYGAFVLEPRLRAYAADPSATRPWWASLMAAMIKYLGQPCGFGAYTCMLRCIFLDPGTSKQYLARSAIRPTTSSALVPLGPCKVCGISRPPSLRPFHCRTCDACVVGHDHHCSVLGVCIARGNRRWFVALLFCGMAAFFVGLLTTATDLIVVTPHMDQQQHHQDFPI